MDNEIRIRMVIASHLSDAQFEMQSGDPELMELANRRLNFVKLLTHTFNDISKYVTEKKLDELWANI